MNEPRLTPEQIKRLATMILALNASEMKQLRELLEDDNDNLAGVLGVIPPERPLKEGGAEVPFEDWPAEYFESME